MPKLSKIGDFEKDNPETGGQESIHSILEISKLQLQSQVDTMPMLPSELLKFNGSP